MRSVNIRVRIQSYLKHLKWPTNKLPNKYKIQVPWTCKNNTRTRSACPSRWLCFLSFDGPPAPWRFGVATRPLPVGAARMTPHKTVSPVRREASSDCVFWSETHIYQGGWMVVAHKMVIRQVGIMRWRGAHTHTHPHLERSWNVCIMLG